MAPPPPGFSEGEKKRKREAPPAFAEAPSPIPERLRKAVYPAPWVVAWSRSNSRAYFFNNETRKSVWEPPEGTRFPEDGA